MPRSELPAVGIHGQEYESWKQLVGAEANGWAAVMVLQIRSNKPFCRVVGPKDTQHEAAREAAKMRRQFRRDQKRAPIEGLKMLAVTVEPIWKELGT